MDNLNPQHSVAATSAVMPNLVPSVKAPSFNKIRNEFIHHPRQFPLEFRRVREWRRSNPALQTPNGDLGLCFVSSEYVATGSTIDLLIPLRGDIQQLRGKVVMVRELVDGYEIGLWLATAEDAARARLVEQICHLECSLNLPTDQLPLPSIAARRQRPRIRFPRGLPQLFTHYTTAHS